MNGWVPVSALVLFGEIVSAAALTALGAAFGGILFQWWRAHGREEHLVHVFRREMQRAERKKVLL